MAWRRSVGGCRLSRGTVSKPATCRRTGNPRASILRWDVQRVLAECQSKAKHVSQFHRLCLPLSLMWGRGDHSMAQGRMKALRGAHDKIHLHQATPQARQHTNAVPMREKGEKNTIACTMGPRSLSSPSAMRNCLASIARSTIVSLYGKLKNNTLAKRNSQHLNPSTYSRAGAKPVFLHAGAPNM